MGGSVGRAHKASVSSKRQRGFRGALSRVPGVARDGFRSPQRYPMWQISQSTSSSGLATTPAPLTADIPSRHDPIKRLSAGNRSLVDPRKV